MVWTWKLWKDRILEKGPRPRLEWGLSSPGKFGTPDLGIFNLFLQEARPKTSDANIFVTEAEEHVYPRGGKKMLDMLVSIKCMP